MFEKLNRRDEIVRVSSTLFVKHGYAATSIRDIAQQVGCTEAAIYYHFKDGKRALLRAVLEAVLPLLMATFDSIRGAKTLGDFVTLYSGQLDQVMTAQAGWFRWIIAEFANFSEAEKNIFHEKHITLYNGLMATLVSYIPDQQQAHQSAWLIMCITIGYMQLFYTLDLKSVDHARQVHLSDLISNALGLKGGSVTR